MKSNVVQTTPLAFALFAFLAVTPVVGGETTMPLPNGGCAVVPSLETNGYDASFERAYIAFRDAFAECGDNCSTGILWTVAEFLSMTCPLTTNNFIRESLEAIKKDDQLIRDGKIQPSPVILRRRTTPNCTAVFKRHRLITAWNRAATEGRQRLLTVASESLKNYLAILDKSNRQRYVEWFIEKAKLSLDEKNIILKLYNDIDEWQSGKTTLAEFQSAMTSRDILECHRSLLPLFDKAISEGTFNDKNTRNSVLCMVMERLLQLRILPADDAVETRFKCMESLLRQVIRCDTITQTNVYFLKLADYLADEKVIPVNDRDNETKEARRKDEALMALGEIESPLVLTTNPHTPNLLALRRKYDSIDRWNNAVRNHRRMVMFLFARPLSLYLSALKDEDARIRFSRLFSTRAGLTQEEAARFFGKQGE